MGFGRPCPPVHDDIVTLRYLFFLSGGECEGGGPGGGDLPCNQIDNDNWDVVVDQDKLTGDRAP